MQEPRGSEKGAGSAGTLLLQVAGAAVIVCLTGLSMWAVGAIQWESHPDSVVLRYWYLAVFLALEVWVCLGLLLSSERWRQGRWAAGLVAFLIWCLATALSALQESRFHSYFDSRIAAAAAPAKLEYATLQSKIAELEAALAAQSVPRRTEAAIRAELEGYEARTDAERYPTKITGLRAELLAAEGYGARAAQLATARARLVALSEAAAQNTDARQVGQRVVLFGQVLPEAVSVWVLIGTMIAIKALGPWLLFGLHRRKPRAPEPPVPDPVTMAVAAAADPDWETVERTDRHGSTRRVRVPRAAMA